MAKKGDGENKSKTTTSGVDEKTKADAVRKTNDAKKEGNELNQTEIEQNDAVYERMVRNIEKAKEAYAIREKALEALGEESELLKEQLVLQNSRLNILGQQADEESRLLEILETQKDAKKDTAALQEKLNQLQADRLENEEEIKKFGKSLGLDLKIQGAEYQKQLGILKATDSSLADRQKALAEISKLTQADTATTEAAVKLQGKIDGITGNIVKKFGMSAKLSDTQLGSFVGIYAEVKKIGGGSGMGMLGKLMGRSVMQSFKLKNIFAQIVEFSAKMALEISNASRAIGSATGFGDQFNNELARMATKGNMAGIGVEEASVALKSLAENVSSFNPAAEKTNEHMGMTVARLQKLGVGAGQSAKAMDFLQRTMSLSGKAAADVTAQIARFGKEVGITATKAMSQFNAVAGRMAMFGQNNIKVFKELSAIAKSTGMEISSLSSLAQNFDKFDTATESVQKLNAVLGTQLSTLEMINASDSEKIMMMRQEVKMSIGSLESLDKHTQMYVAQAMGLKDVGEAQRLLNMSTAEYQGIMAKQKKSADVQKELAEATEELVPMMQQLKLAGTQLLMMFKPVITVFSVGISLISKIIGLFGKLAQGLGITGDGFGKFAEFVVGGFMLMGLAAVAFGAQLAIATGGVSLLVGGLAALFGAFHLKGSPELWELPAASAEGYETMAKSMAVANESALATSASMKGVHDSMHKAGGKSFNIESMAKLDTTKLAAGITKVKSALMELSTLKIDGFLAMSTDGASTSMIMGSDGLIKKISEGKLTVDVNMPEFKMPEINVKVFIGNTELKTLIRQEATAVYSGKRRA